MRGPGGRREVADLAWPLAVGMLSFTMMGVVDTILMGRVGTAAQAGVALAHIAGWLSMSFFRGLATGAQSLVAAADGANDADRRQQGGGAGVLIGLGAGVGAAAVLALVVLPSLGLLAGDAVVAGSARRYMLVQIYGVPIHLLAFGFMAGLQGVGDSRSRMWASVAGNVANVLLDPIFIFGWGPIPAMGETGAALATAIGSAVILVVYLVRYLQLFGWPRLPSRGVLADTLSVGLPTGSQGLLDCTAFGVMSVALARSGAEHLAASQIVLNICSVSFLPAYGVGEAGGVLVGRYLGARQPRTAARALRSARWIAWVLMGCFAVVFAVAGEHLAGFFSQDIRVIELGGWLMIFAAVFQLLDAEATVNLCALRGAGDTRFTLLVTACCAWLVTVPAAVGLGLWLGLGAVGAWLGLTLEIGLLALVTRWRVAGLRDGRVGRLDLLLGGDADAKAAEASTEEEPVANPKAA